MFFFFFDIASMHDRNHESKRIQQIQNSTLEKRYVRKEKSSSYSNEMWSHIHTRGFASIKELIKFLLHPCKFMEELSPWAKQMWYGHMWEENRQNFKNSVVCLICFSICFYYLFTWDFILFCFIFYDFVTCIAIAFNLYLY